MGRCYEIMNFIVQAICNFLISLIGFIFTPIDNLIYQALPSLANALTSVANFFSWLVQFVNWALSWLPLTADTWSFIIAVLIFRLTVPLVVDTIKLVVRWWHALAP